MGLLLWQRRYSQRIDTASAAAAVVAHPGIVTGTRPWNSAPMRPAIEERRVR